VDFVQTALRYGQIIITEKFLPVSMKTIKPLYIGGFAGGEKFICMGILFKFAQDQMLEANGRTFWLYGNDKQNDGLAIKGAGLELLG
jgi:hypothetical protein